MTDPRQTSLLAAAGHVPTQDRVEIERFGAPQSPGRLFWRQFRRSPLAVAGGGLLFVFYTSALLAPFLAAYAPETMDRNRFFHPPHKIHWFDAQGHFRIEIAKELSQKAEGSQNISAGKQFFAESLDFSIFQFGN